jgi:hypothetical protein
MQLLRLIFALLAVLVFSPAKAQSLRGTWQLGSKLSGGELQNDSYLFKADHTFEYVVNNGNGLTRLRALGGTYRQHKGYVELTPTYTREVVGGTLDRSHVLTGNDSWSIEGGTLQKRPIAKPIVQSINIHFIGTTAFVCDETNTFYKIK